MVPMIAGDRPAKQETIQHLFAHAVRDHGEKKLIISDVDGSVFTYTDAGAVVRRIMSALGDEGLSKGDAICMYAPVHVESFLLFWAAASLGVVFVPLDFHWSEKMLERVLGLVKPKILFCERKSFLGFSIIKEQVQTVLFDESGKGDIDCPPVFSAWLDRADREISTPEITPADEAVILYTSGSTGDPKGVVLSHEALYRFGRLVKELYDLMPDDIALSHGDMHSIAGMRAAISPLHSGSSFLVTSISQRSNVFSITECIRRHRCTQFSTTPAAVRQFVQFRDRIPASDLGSLRSILCAGSPLPQYVVDAFYEHFHVPVLNGYGMTEATGLCICHSLESFRHSRGSIGLPVGGCIAEIVDAMGRVCADGVTGELRVRSDKLMKGYFRNRELTDTIMRGGWLYTGDLAQKRPDGHFVLMGRIKNVIKNASGELICVEEVELALEWHSLVREAAVCGFTSTRGDERMAAFIVPDPQSERPEDLVKDLRRYLLEELGAHKVPAEFIMKDRLPRNSMGKLLREHLKQEVVTTGEFP